MTDILKRRGKFRHGEFHVMMKNRDLIDAAVSQQMPIIDSNHQTLGEMYGLDSPSENPERFKFSNTLTSYFQSPVCERMNSVLSHGVCGILLQQT